MASEVSSFCLRDVWTQYRSMLLPFVLTGLDLVGLVGGLLREGEGAGKMKKTKNIQC